MVQRITVIGAGSTGHSAAAYLTQRGFTVTFHDDSRFSSRFEDISRLGGITLRGEAHGTFMPACLTTDPAQAVHKAQAIFVHVMADRHEEIARRIAPYLEDGQHIVIVPGNLGAFVFRSVFREMGISADVTLTEKEGNLCPCRLTAAAEVTVGLPIDAEGRAASLPASDTGRVLEALKGVVEYVPNRNVFEGVINAGNVINHIASTVLAAAEVDRRGDDFSLFKYAFTPAAVRCITKIRLERQAVIHAMGMQEHENPMDMIERVLNLKEHPEVATFYEYMGGPNSLDHRYLHEDCGCGGAFAVSAGKRLGLELPVLTAFLGVAGAINDRDYLGTHGRTLERLGFPAEMSYEQILKEI
ncbi:NAD/NADP octopine/nopaline dehydrogenase family protein [Anaerotruncus colihominis]|uniref:NAD/NADP octopine/nopaline dehydrogenase family protein n=1 Tax=Anaerotruncus colihominis TaxID=169435 RepID=UPI00189BAF2D|nr:NAD/NADP octopine/nopaline dehydrogenase family protein [Anaerotruncus colihominis]